MTNMKQFKRETNSLMYVQMKKLKTNIIYNNKTITTEFKAPDLEQAHTECCRVKHKQHQTISLTLTVGLNMFACAKKNLPNLDRGVMAQHINTQKSVV